MASIQKISRAKGAVYKVTIRQTGNGTICKTFPLKKQAVEFARTVEGDNRLSFALGNPIAKSLTLDTLIEEYLDQYNGKDTCIIGRLDWWSNQYGKLPLSKVGVFVVRVIVILIFDGCLFNLFDI